MRIFTFFIRCSLCALLSILFSCQKQEVNSGTVPTLSEIKITGVNSNSAKVGYTLISQGSSSVSASGICWNIYPNPTLNTNRVDGSSSGDSLMSYMNSLTPNSTYYVCAFAVNKEGIGYSKVNSFTTSYERMTDVEGNVYKITTDGKHTWMVENLRVTKYRNGDPIPNVTYINDWNYLKTDAYCWYKNLSQNKMKGAIYNWYAVNDNRKIAPQGWHVPTLDELKSTRGATNDYSGYCRYGVNDFYEGMCFWTSTGNSDGTAIIFDIWAEDFSSSFSKSGGACVRCLKD